MYIPDIEGAKRLYRELRTVEEKYKDAKTFTGQIRISDMAHDAAFVIKDLLTAWGETSY